MKQALFRFEYTLSCLVGAVALLTLAGGPAMAQGFPSRHISMIYAGASGAPAEAVLRLMSAEAAKALRQPVVVEARPGVGGKLGAQAVTASRGQAYVLCMLANGPLVYEPLRDPSFFQPGKDYTPILATFLGPYLLIVTPSLPVRDVPSLIAYAKANRGKLNWATGSQVSSTHIAMINMNERLGTGFTAIFYKGEPPIWPAMISGESHVGLLSTTTKPHIDAGKMVPLAITTPKRMQMFPSVPTVSEVGLPFLTNVGFWLGIVAPPDIPRDITDRLNRTFGEALRSPEVAKKIAELGFDPIGGSPEDLAAMIRNEMETVGPILKNMKID